MYIISFFFAATVRDINSLSSFSPTSLHGIYPRAVSIKTSRFFYCNTVCRWLRSFFLSGRSCATHSARKSFVSKCNEAAIKYKKRNINCISHDNRIEYILKPMTPCEFRSFLVSVSLTWRFYSGHNRGSLQIMIELFWKNQVAHPKTYT